MSTLMYFKRLVMTLFVALGLAFGHSAFAAGDKDKDEHEDDTARMHLAAYPEGPGPEPADEVNGEHDRDHEEEHETEWEEDEHDEMTDPQEEGW